MYATFYSYSNRVNESEPLVKRPGEIDGQMFNISDCENVTIAIMDVTEQIQIDVVKQSRIFIGACTSSIFIRNCENCVFYTCCRQLRLRDVKNCIFYIYSMAEVHIEFTSDVKFASFNGGYPEHATHLAKATLNLNHNLWYDIFDHNDPQKTNANWSLLPENEYEQPWYPGGIPCEHAVPKTSPGSVTRQTASDSMQSFSFSQLIADSNATATPLVEPFNVPVSDTSNITSTTAATISSDPQRDMVLKLVTAYANYTAGDDISVYILC
jgi:Tubulin binding cofactor C